MPKPQRIRIRPFALPDDPTQRGDVNARLSIEVNGRVLPLAKYVEIVGEIVPPKSAAWRRDAGPS